MRKKERGFSLIEVMIVLILLSILSAIVIPSVGMIHRQEVSRAMDNILMDLPRYGLKAKKNPSNTYRIRVEKSDVSYAYDNSYRIEDIGGETTSPDFRQPTPEPKQIHFKTIPGEIKEGVFTPLIQTEPKNVKEMFFNQSGYLMMTIDGTDRIIPHLLIEVSYEEKFTLSQIINGYTLTGVEK